MDSENRNPGVFGATDPLRWELFSSGKPEVGNGSCEIKKVGEYVIFKKLIIEICQ